MRKGIILICLLVTSILLIACKDKSSDFKSESFRRDLYDSSIFSESFLDIEDAKSLGIMKLSANSNISNKDSNSLLASIQLDSIDTDYKNFIVKVNDVNELEKVKFLINGVYVEQDDLDFTIYKLYVSYNFTFISITPNVQYGEDFVISEVVTTIGIDEQNNPIEEIEYEYGYIEPRDDSKLDSKGISLFDKTNYIDTKVIKNFVVDNSSGKMYSLEDFPVSNINSGLINNNGVIYDFTVANDELLFIPIFSNEQVQVFDYFKDKYGQNYIHNSGIEQLDEDSSTLFFTNGPFWEDPVDGYYLTTENEALYISINRFDSINSLNEVKVIRDNWEKLNIDYTKEYIINSKVIMDGNDQGYDENSYLNIKNGILYLSPYHRGASSVMSYNLSDNSAFELYMSNIDYSYVDITKGQDITVYKDNTVYVMNLYDWYNYLQVNLVKDFFGQYFKYMILVKNHVDFIDVHSERYISKEINGINYHSNSGDIYFNVEDVSYKKIENVQLTSDNQFTKYGINGNTTYFAVYILVNGKYEVDFVTSDYLAPEIPIVTLQPLN